MERLEWQAKWDGAYYDIRVINFVQQYAIICPANKGLKKGYRVPTSQIEIIPK